MSLIRFALATVIVAVVLWLAVAIVVALGYYLIVAAVIVFVAAQIYGAIAAVKGW